MSAPFHGYSPAYGAARLVGDDASLAWPHIRPGVTGGVGFVMFLFLLFLLQLGSLGAVGGMAAAGVLALMNRRALPGLLGARAFIFLIPLLCLFSALWSEDPGATLWYGTEMAVTVAIGLLLSVVDRRSEVLVGLCAAFAVYAVIALVFGHTVGAGTQWAAFSGLNSGKNFMAEIASTGVLTGAGVIVVALDSRRPIWLPAVIAAVAAAALEIYILYLAHSAGAMVALGLGLGALFGLYAVARLGMVWRGLVVGAAGLVLAGVALFHDAVANGLTAVALKALDKDPTLTGRTYLWYRAHQMIAEKPILGHGYAAFWREGNPDAEGLWRFGGIDNHSGFNFHNTGVETLMQFGWTGAVLIVVVVLTGVAFLVRRFVLRPDGLTCFWLALTAFELTRAFYESIGPLAFYFSNILLVAAFGSAFLPARPDFDGAHPAEGR